MFNFEFLKGQNIKPQDGCYILVSDIGGTNANFALAQFKKVVQGPKKTKLILKLRLDSKKIDNFADTIASILNKIKKEFNIEVKLASFACAGVVSIDRESCKISNLGKTLYKKEILEKTSLEKVFLLNDFEAIGYGLQALDKDCLISTGKKSQEKNLEETFNVNEHLTKSYIGAGTGLGKGILIWSEKQNSYIPKPSEGGHADFAAQDDQDLKLLNFIKRQKDNIEWEDILSGQGLKTIFQFLLQENNQTNKYIKEIQKNNFDPALISKYKNKDLLCKKTFEIFTKYYARCAKCFALDTLSRGGIYIAGGIATKNLDIFENEIFMQEFTKSYKLKNLLENIPVYIVTDYHVGLLGAAVFATLHQDNFL